MTESWIIGDCRGDIELFTSLSEATAAIEVIDIQNKEWKLYDSEGRTMIAHIRSKPTFFRWLNREFIELELAESHPTHHDELSDKLRVYLGQLGFQAAMIENASLRELVQLLHNYRLKK